MSVSQNRGPRKWMVSFWLHFNTIQKGSPPKKEISKAKKETHNSGPQCHLKATNVLEPKAAMCDKFSSRTTKPRLPEVGFRQWKLAGAIGR